MEMILKLLEIEKNLQKPSFFLLSFPILLLLFSFYPQPAVRVGTALVV
jgi:hypothetical protein